MAYLHSAMIGGWRPGMTVISEGTVIGGEKNKVVSPCKRRAKNGIVSQYKVSLVVDVSKMINKNIQTASIVMELTGR